jgi:tripartite-type tricarboxylate transporter receptor subunit TctC
MIFAAANSEGDSGVSCRRLIWLAAGGTLATLIAAFPAGAQTYPARDIRVICNFQPGTSADIIARFYAERLSAVAGQNVRVENRTKNSGVEATQAAAASKPDGYTLLITPASATLAAAVHMFKKFKVDPQKDFAPVTTLLRHGYAILVDAKAPVKTLAELSARLKAKGDEAKFGVNSHSSLVAAELYNKVAGTDAEKVQYTNNQKMLTDITTGSTDFVVAEVPWVLEHVKAGRLRPLAVTSGERSSALPDLPTAAEAGLKDYGKVERWWAVLAPNKTPGDVVEKLEGFFNRIIAGEESKRFLGNVGAEAFPGDARKLEALLASEVQRWRDLVKIAGIQPE